MNCREINQNVSVQAPLTEVQAQFTHLILRTNKTGATQGRFFKKKGPRPQVKEYRLLQALHYIIVLNAHASQSSNCSCDHERIGYYTKIRKE